MDPRILLGEPMGPGVDLYALAAMLFTWGWVSLGERPTPPPTADEACEPDEGVACFKTPKPDDSVLASTVGE